MASSCNFAPSWWLFGVYLLSLHVVVCPRLVLEVAEA